MRTDKTLDNEILKSKDWNDERPDLHLTYNVFEEVEEDGQRRVIMNSLSGWERNHLFMNTGGKFQDVSLISGMDTDADSRAHCSLDIDHDGFSDVAVVSGSQPQLKIFKNRLEEISESKGNFVALKLVGGNSTSQPSSEWSCRDAVGTLVTVSADGLKYVRELRFGEGFAGQNSTTLVLGIGEATEANLEIKWLSGKSQTFEQVNSGQLVIVYENTSESDSGTGLDVREYQAVVPSPDAQTEGQALEYDTITIAPPDTNKNFSLLTSMATWCSACKKMKPQLSILTETFNDQIESLGLPMDENDTAEALEKYMADNSPPYKLLTNTTMEQRTTFAEIMTRTRGKAALPSTILIDANGRVIESWLSVPTVSEMAVTLQKAMQK